MEHNILWFCLRKEKGQESDVCVNPNINLLYEIPKKNGHNTLDVTLEPCL